MQQSAALALLLNAFIFGLSWWPFRALQAQGLHPLWATAFTFVLSVGVTTLLRRTAWQALRRQPWLWLLLLASGLSNACFNWAVTTGDVVRVVLLFYLMPAWALLLAWPLLGERPGRGAVLRLAVALAGVVLVLKTPEAPWPAPQSLADWLALLGGFCFALTNVLLRRLQHTPADARMLAMFVGGALVSGLAAVVGRAMGLVGAVPAPDLAWLSLAAGLGVALLLGNLALQYGAARLRASTTSVLMLTEVVFASASSALFGTGTLTLQIVLGGVLIVLASLLALPARSDPKALTHESGQSSTPGA